MVIREYELVSRIANRSCAKVVWDRGLTEFTMHLYTEIREILEPTVSLDELNSEFDQQGEHIRALYADCNAVVGFDELGDLFNQLELESILIPLALELASREQRLERYMPVVRWISHVNSCGFVAAGLDHVGEQDFITVIEPQYVLTNRQKTV